MRALHVHSKYLLCDVYIKIMMISPKRQAGYWEWEDVEVKSCKSSNTLGVFANRSLPVGSFFLVFGSSTWQAATAKLDIHRFIRHNKEIDRKCEVLTEKVNCKFESMLLSDLLTGDVLNLDWVTDDNVKYLVQPAITLMQAPALYTDFTIAKNLLDIKTLQLPVYVCRITSAVEANAELRWGYNQWTEPELNSIMTYRTEDAYINTSKIVSRSEDIKTLILVKPVHVCKDDYKWVIDENEDAECCNLAMFTWCLTDQFMSIVQNYGRSTFNGRILNVIERLCNVYWGSKDIHVFDYDTRRPLVHRCIDYVDIIMLKKLLLENLTVPSRSLLLQLEVIIEDAYKQFDCFISLFKDHREESILESVRLMVQLDPDRVKKGVYQNISDRMRVYYDERIKEYKRVALSDRDYDRMVSYIKRKVYPLETTAKLLGIYADVWSLKDLEQRMLYITREEWNERDTVMDSAKREAMSTWLERLKSAKSYFLVEAAAKRAQLDTNIQSLMNMRDRIQPIASEKKCARNWMLYENVEGGVFSSTQLNVKTRLLRLTPPIEGGLGITTRIRYTDDYNVNNCIIENPDSSILFKLLMNNAWANSVSSHMYIREDIRNALIEKLQTSLKTFDNVDEKLVLMYQTKTPTFNNLIKASIKEKIDLQLRTVNVSKSVNPGNELLLLSDAGTEAKRRAPSLIPAPAPPIQDIPQTKLSSNSDSKDTDYPIPLPPSTEPVDNPDISPIENAYKSLVYKYWNQDSLGIKAFGEIEQMINVGYPPKKLNLESIRKEIREIIEKLKTLPDGLITDDVLRVVMSPSLLKLLRSDRKVNSGEMKRDEVIERYERLLEKMISYTAPSDPQPKMPLSVLKKRRDFYKNMAQTTFPNVAETAGKYEKMYNLKLQALEAARRENADDSGTPQAKRPRILAAPPGAPGAPMGALAPVRVSQSCLEQYRALANVNLVNGQLVELGARLCMNQETNIIDKLIIPPQESTITSWEEKGDTDVGENYTRFGQIHSHVAAWTCFLSDTDIRHQYFNQRNESPHAIMVIYSQNCGSPSANVEGRLGMVQLDQGAPNHDGFKAYTLRPDILNMEFDTFDRFMTESYDNTSQYQRVYTAANWQIVNVPGTVEDLRPAAQAADVIEVDGGEYKRPIAMESVLRELAYA